MTLSHPLPRVSIVFGTRPEAIKLAPLILQLRQSAACDVHVCVTAQHREMLDQVLREFAIVPDADLNLMQPDQTLGALTQSALHALDQYYQMFEPALVLVQGDTTTVFCAALAACYHKIPVGHVEAGLRTGDKFAPFPEEINRVLTSRLTDLHFAPTDWAADNLRAEGIPQERIFVTGNTVIDALYLMLERIRENPPDIPGLPAEVLDRAADERLILITGHRRESFGAGFEAICRAIAELAAAFPRCRFVYPVHLNPNVREPVYRLLGRRDNVRLIEPLGYREFVCLMSKAQLILTDSGGIQEEAPALGIPVLVMREKTERPEGVAAGAVKLVGADRKKIFETASALLNDPAQYRQMAQARDPYGDGRAAGRIAAILRDFLG